MPKLLREKDRLIARLSAFSLAWLMTTGWLLAQSMDQKLDFFESKIRPVLAEHCWSCHSQRANKSNGGLQLDSPQAILSGGDNGPLVSSEDREKSHLLRAIQGGDNEISAMPPTGTALSAQQIHDFQKWIADGAAMPESIQHHLDVGVHWSFRPVQSPTVPKLDNNAWPKTDIDRFLLAKQMDHDLQPSQVYHHPSQP
jgi:cytochrome c553